MPSDLAYLQDLKEHTLYSPEASTNASEEKSLQTQA